MDDLAYIQLRAEFSSLHVLEIDLVQGNRCSRASIEAKAIRVNKFLRCRSIDGRRSKEKLPEKLRQKLYDISGFVDARTAK